MTFDDFKFVCFTQGIDPAFIEPYREFVRENFGEYESLINRPTNDMGYAELAEITNSKQAMEILKDFIENYSAYAEDSLGRSMVKRRIAELKRKPNKAIGRRVLKALYLLHHGH